MKTDLMQVEALKLAEITFKLSKSVVPRTVEFGFDGKLGEPCVYEVAWEYTMNLGSSEDHLGSTSANYYREFMWNDDE